MSGFLRILTQDAEVKHSIKNKEYLENKEYLIGEIKFLAGLKSFSGFNTEVLENKDIQVEGSEDIVEHYKQIAEQSKDLVSLLKKKNSSLHSDIRDLEIRYQELSGESEAMDKEIEGLKVNALNLQEGLKTNQKVFQAELCQLSQENLLLKSDTIEEFKAIQGNLVSEIERIKAAVEETYNSVEKYQEYLLQKQEKLEKQSNFMEKSQKNYEILLNKHKELEDTLKLKEKQASQVFNDLASAKAQLKVLKAKKSEGEERKIQNKLIDLEKNLANKKKENSELREKIGYKIKNLDGPLQYNRIGSGKKYSSEVVNV